MFSEKKSTAVFMVSSCGLFLWKFQAATRGHFFLRPDIFGPPPTIQQGAA